MDVFDIKNHLEVMDYVIYYINTFSLQKYLKSLNSGILNTLSFFFLDYLVVLILMCSAAFTHS